jgi:hypothetical protein
VKSEFFRPNKIEQKIVLRVLLSNDHMCEVIVCQRQQSKYTNSINMIDGDKHGISCLIYRILLVGLLFLSGSCKEKIDLVEYKEGRQLLIVNNLKRNGDSLAAIKIGSIGLDSIEVGKELLIKIFIESPDLKVVDAFIYCKPVSEPSVDTLTFKISGCSQGLIVQNDTVLIGFKPEQVGSYAFPEITMLTRDGERVYRTAKYTFNYNVY